MDTIKSNARIAGVLYLLLVLVAPLRLVHIPNTQFVGGDIPATVAALLVMRSGFLPRFVGVWLLANAVAYLALSLAALAAPRFNAIVSLLVLPAQIVGIRGRLGTSSQLALPGAVA